MTTFTALTTLPGRAAAEQLGLALEELDPAPMGVGVFEIEDDSGLYEVGAYFEEQPDGIALTLLAVAHGAAEFAISELPETDWVAKVRRDLRPVEAGRFFVYGSHDADKVPEGRIALLIEAAMAFGTGHHGTTQGCLLALDALIDAGIQVRSVADVGAGTAVLAMAAARVYPVTAVAGDIDPVAVEVAEANIAANDLGGRVLAVDAAGIDHAEFAARAPFDLVFANILKGPLLDLCERLVAATSAGGHLILSGILNEQADQVATAYAAAGAPVVRRKELGDWTTLTMQKTA